MNFTLCFKAQKRIVYLIVFEGLSCEINPHSGCQKPVKYTVHQTWVIITWGKSISFKI